MLYFYGPKIWTSNIAAAIVFEGSYSIAYTPPNFENGSFCSSNFGFDCGHLAQRNLSIKSPFDLTIAVQKDPNQRLPITSEVNSHCILLMGPSIIYQAVKFTELVVEYEDLKIFKPALPSKSISCEAPSPYLTSNLRIVITFE